MAQGTVKWFNGEKGFGFISPDGGGPDVFVHFSAIVGTGYRNLEENQRVEFEITPGQRRPQTSAVYRDTQRGTGFWACHDCQCGGTPLLGAIGRIDTQRNQRGGVVSVVAHAWASQAGVRVTRVSDWGSPTPSVEPLRRDAWARVTAPADRSDHDQLIQRPADDRAQGAKR